MSEIIEEKHYNTSDDEEAQREELNWKLERYLSVQLASQIEQAAEQAARQRKPKCHCVTM